MIKAMPRGQHFIVVPPSKTSNHRHTHKHKKEEKKRREKRDKHRRSKSESDDEDGEQTPTQRRSVDMGMQAGYYARGTDSR